MSVQEVNPHPRVLRERRSNIHKIFSRLSHVKLLNLISIGFGHRIYTKTKEEISADKSWRLFCVDSRASLCSLCFCVRI